MKTCSRCQFSNDDTSKFCKKCGSKLTTESEISEQADSNSFNHIHSDIAREKVSVHKGILVTIILVVITAIVIYSINSIVQIKKIKSQNEAYRYAKWAEEELSKPSLYDARIVDYDVELDGDWIYVRGEIRNNSDKDIGYYEITVEFENSTGRVIDSDWTNGSDLRSGTSQQFEVMSQYTTGTKDVNVEITEVS